MFASELGIGLEPTVIVALAVIVGNAVYRHHQRQRRRAVDHAYPQSHVHQVPFPYDQDHPSGTMFASLNDNRDH